MNFYLFNVTAGGWLTQTGNYSSSTKDAKQFEEADAVELCARNYFQEQHLVIPVRTGDLAKVRAQV